MTPRAHQPPRKFPIRLASFPLAAAVLLGAAAGAQAQNKVTLQVVGNLGITTQSKELEAPFWNKDIPAATKGAVTANFKPWNEMGLKGPEVFRLLGLPVTEEQLALHVHLHDLGVDRLTPDRVRALHAWTLALVRSNQEHGVFPLDTFQAEVQWHWSRLFWSLADRSPMAAWAHLRCSGTWSTRRLRYWLQSVLRSR